MPMNYMYMIKYKIFIYINKKIKWAYVVQTIVFAKVLFNYRVKKLTIVNFQKFHVLKNNI